MSEPLKSTQPPEMFKRIIGVIVGWGLSKYAGASLWIPGIASLLLLLLFSKTRLRPAYFQGAIAITGGHIVWFVAAALVTQLWPAVALDVLLFTVGIAWLWIWPNLTGVLLLGLFQLISLVSNVMTILAVPIGSPEHRALTVHCVWRIMAIVALGVGYAKYRKARQAAGDPPPIPMNPESI